MTIDQLQARIKELEAERDKWRELYRAAWEECDWHRGRESICNEPRWPDACMAHDALRAKHGVEENAQ